MLFAKLKMLRLCSIVLCRLFNLLLSPTNLYCNWIYWILG